ncbi:MAG: hypothetical protein J0L61_00155 [Planctomycetes bacterium]|nr:hypothetical protein [Planctomycetota bacterium]
MMTSSAAVSPVRRGAGVPSWCAALMVGVGALGAGTPAHAQSLVGATANSAGSSTLIVIDPLTGANLPYLSVPVTGSLNRQVYFLTQIPDGRLAASIYTENSNADVTSELMLIDPQPGTSGIIPFGAPLNTSYLEGLEYSPRHGKLLVSFANFGNFGTNRLAQVNFDGTVASTTAALAGISDLDTILSSDTLDLFFDLNATSSPRVKNLVNPLPATTFAGFSSPPTQAAWFDGGIHPTTGEVIFTRPISGMSQLTRLVGNAYVAGANIAGGRQVRGMTWAFLPARGTVSSAPLVCPNVPVTLAATPVGTGPFTVQWQYRGGPPPASVADWTDIVPGVNVAPAGTGAPGRFLFNATGATTTLLSVDRATVPPGDPGEPNWSHAGVGQFRFRAVITGSVGAAFATADTTFQLVSDLNFDGVVGTADLTVFLGRFGQPAPLGSDAARADFNADAIVDTADLAFFLGRFGSACP